MHAFCAVLARRPPVLVHTLGLALATAHAGAASPEGGGADDPGHGLSGEKKLDELKLDKIMLHPNPGKAIKGKRRGWGCRPLSTMLRDDSDSGPAEGVLEPRGIGAGTDSDSTRNKQEIVAGAAQKRSQT